MTAICVLQVTHEQWQEIKTNEAVAFVAVFLRNNIHFPFCRKAH